MKRLHPACCTRLMVLLAALPAIAFAHPGHEGDHELTWDFGSGLGHVHYGQALVAALLLVGAGFGISKLAARFFKR